MRGATGLFTDYRGIAIEVSWPAQQLIGQKNVPKFVRVLTEMMATMGAKKAYVSKRGAAVDVHILNPEGWRFDMKLQRGS